MKTVTFITGNEDKAKYLEAYLGIPIEHKKLDLPEIQSLDLKEVVKYKMKEAFNVLQTPVLVEDVALEFTALGKLPGTFIKWFLEEMSEDDICKLLDGKDRAAIARCTFGFYDGNEEKYFEGSLAGTVPPSPRGDGGYGWDRLFIPEGYSITRAEMSEEDDKKTYLCIKPFDQVKKFLKNY